MKSSFLPSLILLLLAAALYMLPDGSLYSWRLSLRGAIARLNRPPDPRHDATEDVFSSNRDLLLLLQQREAEVADMRRRLADAGVTAGAVPGFAIVSARVVRLGPDNTLDTFTIDAGTADGVEPGQAVVVGAALAGVVAKSERDASIVLSLSSSGCYLSARLGEPGGSVDRARLLCAVKGQGAGEAAVVVFTTATAAKVGWVALTSGLEGSIPEGLVLGTVAGDLEEGEENGTLEGRLRTAADLTSLDFVSVVRSASSPSTQSNL